MGVYTRPDSPFYWLFEDDEKDRWFKELAFRVGLPLAATAVVWALCPESQHEPPAAIHEHVPHQHFGDLGSLRGSAVVAAGSSTEITVPTGWLTMTGYQPVLRVGPHPAYGLTVVEPLGPLGEDGRS